MSHTKKTVLSSLKEHYSTKLAVIPGGMTSLLQPVDICWNKPFKAAMRDKWLDWLTTGEEGFTKSGRQKQASYKMDVTGSTVLV